MKAEDALLTAFVKAFVFFAQMIVWLLNQLFTGPKKPKKGV